MLQRDEIIGFIRNHPLCFLASCEGDQARVRALMVHRIDDDGTIIFTVGKNKSVYKQLSENPRVEGCFYAEGKQVRVVGALEESSDQSLKEEIVQARPFMQTWIEHAGFDIIAVFRLKNTRATSYDTEQPLSRKRWIDL